MILCPKCGKLNPPIKSEINIHYNETCHYIIGVKTYFWGLISKPIRCNFIGAFDEDDDWHYVHINKDNSIVLDKESDLCSIHSIKKVIY